ncbi:NAPDH-dependent diflavin reductase [Ascosphaera acerosa]|nr:NAPDH-dependent diflavin reductase [Ascosphaera acerosa]
MTLDAPDPASSAPALSRRVLVAYGSETGNAQDIAEELGRLATRLRCATSVRELNDVVASRLAQEYDACIFVVATTGQGEFPQNARAFWRSLLPRRLSAAFLRGVRCTVLGLGDSSYAKFNFAARKLRKRLLQLGAETLCQHGECDEQHESGNDATVIPWSAGLRQALLAALPLPAGADPIPEGVQLPPEWVLESCAPSSGAEAQPPTIDLAVDDRPLPDTFAATLVANERVTPRAHWQDVRHMVLSTPAPLAYGPGDIVQVFPRNPPEDVAALLALLGWADAADQPVRVVRGAATSVSAPVPIPLPRDGATTLRALLTDHLDFNCVPRRFFFAQLAHFARSAAQRERLAEFADPALADELYDYTTRPRRSILEVLQEFDSVRVPWQQALCVLPPLRPRQFSVASGGALKRMPIPGIPGGAGECTRIDLLVAIVRYQTIIRKRREGTCTRYLARLPAGATLRVRLERGTGLNVAPQQLAAPALLVGPGTGVAPLRAYRPTKTAKQRSLERGAASDEC